MKLIPVILTCLKDIASDPFITGDTRKVAHHIYIHLNTYYIEEKLDAVKKSRTSQPPSSL